MKAFLKRVAALENAHQPTRFQGALDFHEGSETVAQAVARAGAPGIYALLIDDGDSCELLVVAYRAGQLVVTERCTP